MNRINKLFNEKKQNILSLYFCADTRRPEVRLTSSAHWPHEA